MELGLQSGDSALKAAADAAPHAALPAGSGPERSCRGRPRARKGGSPSGSEGPCRERRASVRRVRADGSCNSGSRGMCHKCGGRGRAWSHPGPLPGAAVPRRCPGSLLVGRRKPEATVPCHAVKESVSRRNTFSPFSQPLLFPVGTKFPLPCGNACVGNHKSLLVSALASGPVLGSLSGGIWEPKDTLGFITAAPLFSHRRQPKAQRDCVICYQLRRLWQKPGLGH